MIHCSKEKEIQIEHRDYSQWSQTFRSLLKSTNHLLIIENSRGQLIEQRIPVMIILYQHYPSIDILSILPLFKQNDSLQRDTTSTMTTATNAWDGRDGVSWKVWGAIDIHWWCWCWCWYCCWFTVVWCKGWYTSTVMKFLKPKTLEKHPFGLRVEVVMAPLWRVKGLGCCSHCHMIRYWKGVTHPLEFGWIPDVWNCNTGLEWV